MTREVGPRLPFIPRQGLSEEKSCVTGPGERDPDQFGNDHPPLTENRNENLFQAKIGPPIAREILEPFVKTNLTAQSVRDILSESVEKAHRENGIRYSSDSHADVETLQKLTKTKYNKKIHHAMLAELSQRGILENLPRSSVQLGDLGKMSHYKLDDQFQPIEGFGNATIDEKKLANLAQFNFEEGGPALLRHAKVISKEQWNGIKQLAEKRITPEAQRSIDEGDQLQPAIFRYDQKRLLV